MAHCLFPRDVIIRKDSRPPSPAEVRYGVDGSQFVSVGCGKCINCLKKRQDDLALRAMREAGKRGSMHFVTLTYEDSFLPLQVRLERIDKSTGEVFHDYPSSPLIRYKGFVEDDASKEFVSFVRNELNFVRAGSSPRVITSTFYENEESLYRFEITPSLCRRDVRLWLKSCRVRFQREKGFPLPDFSYIVCGEYGPRTCRPHYHVAFFGLSTDVVSWLVLQWQYGFTNLKTVNAFNADGTNGFEIASRYVGKYMSKGTFECESVKCGLSEKPRLMLSRHLGVELSFELVSYFRCYDVVGEYDIKTCRFSDGRLFTEPDFKRLLEAVSQRNYFSFGSRKYAIPRSIIIKLWYCYDSSKKCYYSSPLRVKMLSLVQSNVSEDYARMLRTNYPGLSERAIFLRCREFLDSSENSSILQDAFGKKALGNWYAHSIF